MNQQIAIIELGGSQHLVKHGERLKVMQLTHPEGATFEVEDLLSKEKVTCKVVKHFLGEKVRGLFFRPKTRSTRRWGHRDRLSEVEIIGIGEWQKPQVKKTQRGKDRSVKTPANKKVSKELSVSAKVNSKSQTSAKLPSAKKISSGRSVKAAQAKEKAIKK